MTGLGWGNCNPNSLYCLDGGINPNKSWERGVKPNCLDKTWERGKEELTLTACASLGKEELTLTACTNLGKESYI